jgi:hypothetical protein
LKDFGHIGKNGLIRQDLRGGVDEKDVHRGLQQVFLEPICLPDAALEEITLYRALEKALGNGDNNSGRYRFLRFARNDSCDIFAPEATGRKALSTLKESGDSLLAAQTLRLWKGKGHYRLSR